MENEEWRNSPTLPQYDVSSLGRIRRVPFTAPMPHGGTRTYGGHEWPGVWSEEDQRFIFVFKGKTYRVAPLVCEAFNGPKPTPAHVCCHDDEDSRNNRHDNLKWGTQTQNLNYPGYLAKIRGKGRPQKIKGPDRAAIPARLAAGERPADLAREFEVAACTISNIAARARK